MGDVNRKLNMPASYSHIRLSAVSTPVVGFVPDAILHSAVTVERSSSASVKSAPVMSTFLSKNAFTRFAFVKFTFRKLAF